MASVGSIRLIGDADGAVEVTAPLIGEGKRTEEKQLDFIAVLSNDAAVNVGGDIEHSPDGEKWFPLATMPTVNNGTSIVEITSAVLGHVRANLTTAAGTSNVLCELRYDKRGK